MPYIPVLIRAQQLVGDSGAKVVLETSKESLRTLLRSVADGELTVEEALACIDFEPEEGESPAETTASMELPLRFRFACDRDAIRIVLMTVRDGIHSVEKVLSCFNFSGETGATARGD